MPIRTLVNSIIRHKRGGGVGLRDWRQARALREQRERHRAARRRRPTAHPKLTLPGGLFPSGGRPTGVVRRAARWVGRLFGRPGGDR